MICHKKVTFKRLFAFALCFRRVRIVLASAMIIWISGQNSFAGTNQINDANKLVKQMMIEVESILAKDINDNVARRKNVSALFDRYFDLPTIAKFSAGPYWRAADANQKTAYESAIRDVIIGTVVRNFDRLSGLKFIATDSQAKGTQLVLVNGTFTDINQQQPPIMVGWRVVTADTTSPLILDVEIENISMLVTQKQENIAIIRKNEGKFEALIDAMKQRSQSNN
jgi:phospholipid transport system substrate-binding protein